MTGTTSASQKSDGRPKPSADGEDVLGIVRKYEGREGGMIAILEEIQARHGYLPEDTLRAVSKHTGCALVDIYGIATFYRSFSLKPRGEHLVCACLGTACHVRGAPDVVAGLQQQLGIQPGETTPDRQFTLETVNCLGACAVGPVVVIDGHYLSKVRAKKVGQLLEQAHDGFDTTQPGMEVPPFPIEVSCIRCNHSLMDGGHALDGRAAIRLVASAGQEHGCLWLSSLYGSPACRYEPDVAPGTVVRVFCPHCHAELAGASNCSACHAPLVPTLIRAGGIAQFCSRRGCPGRQLDLDGIDGDAVRERADT